MVWLKMIALFVTLLLLQYSMKVETAQLECPLDQVRLIGPDDVNNSYVEQGLVDFSTLLSHTPPSDGEYFQSSTLPPNTGNLTFSEPFLLLGFTTQGVIRSWVSTFTFQYSDSLDGPYQTYQTFRVNTINETLFIFQEPILAQRIQLLVSVIALILPLPDRYYWRMNLFGCAEADATSISQPMETSSVCPDPSVISTVSQTTCIDPPISSPVPVFITVTSTVTTCTVTASTVTTSTVTTCTVMETPVQFADQKSDNCQKELTAAIVVPVIIILILIVLTVTILIVYLTRIRNRFDPKSTITIHDLPTTCHQNSNVLTEDQTDDQLEDIPSDQIHEHDYADINQRKNNSVYVEGDGGHQLQDNPAYMKGLSGDGGYQVEDNPSYMKGLSGDGGYQVDDNPSYMKGLSGNGGYEVEDNPSYMKGLSGDGGYEVEDNPAYTKGLSGDGGYQVEDNPSYMKGLSGDGGYQVEDNPAYTKGLSGDGGYQVEDNPSYMKGLSGDGGYQVEDNPAYMKGLTGDGGYQVEDNPSYMKGLSGDGGYRLEDNPAYI